ncbi:MAG: hypothetical protein Q7U36_03350 [bacterium]|nr:hypothetical protein [bacterium]
MKKKGINPEIEAEEKVTTEIKQFLEEKGIFEKINLRVKKHIAHLGLTDFEEDNFIRKCFHEALHY